VSASADRAGGWHDADSIPVVRSKKPANQAVFWISEPFSRIRHDV
jgi:hypothetical protein